MTIVHGVRTGAVSRFVTRFTPWVLLILPVLVSETVEAGMYLAGRLVIGDYLLQMEDREFQEPLLLVGVIETLYLAVAVYFLWPLFKTSPARHRQESIEPLLLTRAKRRLQLYPFFLIGATYATWTILAVAVMILSPLPEGISYVPLVATIFFALLTNALVSYYSTDFLNRVYLVPYWFPNGKVAPVKRKFNPPMILRYMDTFMFIGVLPVVSLVGLTALVWQYGTGDADQVFRLMVSGAIIGLIYWFFGFLLTLLHAGSVILPLRSMEKGARDLMEERFDTRVVVQGDDPLGHLSQTFNRMSAELQEKQKIKTLFGHYVSPAIRDLILQNRVNTRGDAIEAVVLFSDIRSFTQLTESTDPEIVVELLNIHFSRVVDIVTENNGFVDKFIGDAVMAVFDAEFCDNRHRFYALNTACDILRNMQETNRQISQRLGVPEIDIGVGVACGRVIRGNIGSESRRELTVIGDTVNIASRLESATRHAGYPLIFTHDSYDPFIDEAADIELTRIEQLTIRGKTEPVQAMGAHFRS